MSGPIISGVDGISFNGTSRKSPPCRLNLSGKISTGPHDEALATRSSLSLQIYFDSGSLFGSHC
jgi:hypothetical protein